MRWKRVISCYYNTTYKENVDDSNADKTKIFFLFSKLFDELGVQRDETIGFFLGMNGCLGEFGLIGKIIHVY